MFERSQETEEHAGRLIEMTRRVGMELNLTQVELDELELLATLHDIGKVGIEDRILNKTGKLTGEEWSEMKKHPEIGYRIAMSSPDLMSIAEYILCHHERWDGKGYPQGLKGEEIPILSRILAIADAYDAMTQDRPYRKAMSKEEAAAEIKKNAGSQFDPEIARVFIDRVLK
jgi:HD-GYP domain-containing protein (c-di-GMP phosphodiesterase class II)